MKLAKLQSKIRQRQNKDGKIEGQSQLQNRCINAKQNICKQNQPMNILENIVLCVRLTSVMLGRFNIRKQTMCSPV